MAGAATVLGKAEPAVPGTGRGWAARLISAGLTLVLVVVGLLALLLVAVPRATGGAALTVLTGSMQPTLNPGDVVVVRPVGPDRDVRVGDVITFQPVSGDPTLITHRVVSRSSATGGATFVTRGDANGADDNPIKGAQIAGKVWFRVPLVGYGVIWLGEHRQLAMTVAGVMLLGYAGAVAFGGFGRRRSQKGGEE